MSNYISVEELINILEEKNIKFGKGDPYNRLRYYTKVGWLPNMKRIKDKSGNITGHYPKWVVNRIINIEGMKENGLSNDEINKKIGTQTKTVDIINRIYSPESINRFQRIGIGLILILIVFLQIQIIDKKRSEENALKNTFGEKIILIASGNATIKFGMNKMFIQYNNIKPYHKILIIPKSPELIENGYWVGPIEENKGFTINLKQPAKQDISFYWWLSQ